MSLYYRRKSIDVRQATLNTNGSTQLICNMKTIKGITLGKTAYC